jgi:hypothetical protein
MQVSDQPSPRVKRPNTSQTVHQVEPSAGMIIVTKRKTHIHLNYWGFGLCQSKNYKTERFGKWVCFRP